MAADQGLHLLLPGRVVKDFDDPSGSCLICFGTSAKCWEEMADSSWKRDRSLGF